MDTMELVAVEGSDQLQDSVLRCAVQCLSTPEGGAVMPSPMAIFGEILARVLAAEGWGGHESRM